jgi:asparagine synthase (glutamine-hydrolysing)
MCGIAGFIHLSSAVQDNQELLHAMQCALVHRGPDGFGVWLSNDKQIGFAHRRLSILDLSTAAAQPMMDCEQTVIVSYNGEIYNNPELRQELETLGYTYFSNSDTETILYAYKQWGIEGIKRFDGMFAIALYDLVKQELYLVRDRFGIKPLYFSLQGGMLTFASEIKALWQVPWITQELNTQGLYHYLTYLVTPAPMTLYQGIYKLPASFYAKVDRHKKVTFHEWYTPLQPAQVYSSQELNDEQFCIERIRTLLRCSIKKQMLSDVPYGVFLSGGIDSSLNVALMAEYTLQVKTFTISFADGPEFNEVQWARTIAKRFNTDHHETVITEKEAFDFFERMVYHQDEPLADCVCIPLYYVAKLLKDAGVTVVQVGEGSDELFCGYSSYAQYLELNRYWQPTQRMLPRFVRQAVSILAERLFPHQHNHVAALKNWAVGNHLFWSGATAFTEPWKKGFWIEQLLQHDPIIEQIYTGLNQSYDSYAIVDYHLRKLKAYKPNADFLTSMIYLELKQRLSELLLMRVDKMAMATSVEGRVPFLDHELVEFALQIPSHLKYKNGVTKYILKKACEGILPHEIIYRKKMGFAAPTSRWFKEGRYFKPYFNQLLQERRNRLAPYLKQEVLHDLLRHNQQLTVDYALPLWVVQNVIAMDVFNQ